MRKAAALILAFAPVLATAADLTQQAADSVTQTESAATEKALLEKRIEELERAKEELQKAKAAHEDATRAIAEEQERLERRVGELEAAQTAQEDATRAIIQDSVSTLGSKINEYVTFGGSIEVVGGWTKDFSGERENVLELNTVDLNFEVQANDWVVANLVIEFDPGTDVLFPTSQGTEAGVDRFTINTAAITIGNTEKFPPFTVVGRLFVPFGISTGDPVADVLSIQDPLTIQVFETQEDAIGFGLAFPTPDLTPAAPPISPPQVKPQVITPFVSSVSRRLGYDPPPKPPPAPALVYPTPAPPPFNAGVYFYNGDTFEGTDSTWNPGEHIGATAGFRTKGDCGRSYEELGADGQWDWSTFGCPWSIDVDIDYNSSVFDSNFLQNGYEGFLGQIGFVPGMATSVKANLGAVSVVAEWNGAINNAKFFDDAGRFISMKPRAWQISLGYQFDWNPWVEKIGEQGTFVALGYSESRDLAGVTKITGGEAERVGTVPKRRLLVSAGEWVLDDLLLTVEYSHIVDYSKSEGGTGGTGNGIFTQLTFVW